MAPEAAGDIILVSSDQERIPIARKAVQLSRTLGDMFTNLGLNHDEAHLEPIPVTTVTTQILRKVVEYCTQHMDEPIPAESTNERIPATAIDAITEWDAEFMKVSAYFLHF